MNILIATLGSHGDVHPFVGVGRTLADRGHQVTLLTNEAFRELGERYELDFVDIGSTEEYEQATTDPDIRHPRRGLGAIARLAAPALPILYRELESRLTDDTVIVAASLAFSARIIRERHRVPLVTTHLAPALLRSNLDPPRLPGPRVPAWVPAPVVGGLWWLADQVIDRALGPPIETVREPLGLPRTRSYLGAWSQSPDRVLGLFPEWYASIPADSAMTDQVSFPLFDEADTAPSSPELEAFLSEGEPPILFTPGTANRHAAQFFETGVDAARRIGRRALLLSKFDNPAPTGPDVLHLPYVPFSQVLPRVGALVHHGGIGTTAQALRAGTPQLIHALAHDQYDNGTRVSRLGVGAWTVPRKFRAANVARTLEHLLTSESVRISAETLSRQLGAEDGRRSAAELIETTRVAP